MKKQITIQFLLLILFFFLNGCASRQHVKRNPERKNVYVFDCAEGNTFTAEIFNDKSKIYLDDSTFTLPKVKSASGVKYSNGKFIFWNKGEKWILITPEKEYKNCRINRRKAVFAEPRLRGIDFRGQGNEPGWYVEIDDGNSIYLVTDYGENEYLFKAPEPDKFKRKKLTVYKTKNKNHTLKIEIRKGRCSGAMGGELFDSKVKVFIDDKVYTGCGKNLK
ncbi:MAG: MliC family protein [Elusimicrobiota bacterium]